MIVEKGLISPEEDGLIYELATDSDRSIGSRAFSYFYKYQLKENDKENDNDNDNDNDNAKNKKAKKGKKGKGKPTVPKKNGLLKVIEYLQEFAQDDKEINHVFFFVRNCAGDRANLLNEENKSVLDVQGIVELLNKQQQDVGLNGRQTSLLVCIERIFHVGCAAESSCSVVS